MSPCASGSWAQPLLRRRLRHGDVVSVGAVNPLDQPAARKRYEIAKTANRQRQGNIRQEALFPMCDKGPKCPLGSHETPRQAHFRGAKIFVA
jgi:hypothetical protein